MGKGIEITKNVSGGGSEKTAREDVQCVPHCHIDNSWFMVHSKGLNAYRWGQFVTRSILMWQRISVAVTAMVFINAVPAHAALYFDWINPLTQIGPVVSSSAAAYNPPEASEFPGQWYELGWGDGYGDHGGDPAYYPAFILKSDSGQSGSVPVEIRLTLSGNVWVGDDNAANTEFQILDRLAYGIESLDGLYGNVFDMDADLFNETSYSRTKYFLDSLEIGGSYRVSGALINGPPVRTAGEPLDPDSPAFTIITNESYGDIAFSALSTSTPEPATIFLFGSGILGALARRRCWGMGIRHGHLGVSI